MTLDHTAPHVGDRYTPTKIAWRTRLGPVWFARDQVLGRQVLIQTVEADDHDTRARFRASAAAHARVTNPGVIQVFDIGADPPFVVFENPGGGRLSDRLRAGPLPTAEAARIALALARALEALHGAGLHHGALRPDVVLLDPDGRAKVLALDPDGDVDQPASYRPRDTVAPDAADVYALAALTFHMVTGNAPGTVTGRRAAGNLEPILRRALDADPARRPPLDRFIGELAPFARVTPARTGAPRARAVEFRWLVPAVIIVTLAVLAATFGVKIAQDLADRTADDVPTPTARPTLVALSIVEAADFDPEGDREENPDLVDLAIDGDAVSAWRTERYERAGLGGKSGVGLRVDLGEPTSINRIQVITEHPGWTAQVLLGDEVGRRARDYTSAATFTAASPSRTVRLPQATTTRYVVIWITQLVDAADGKDPPYVASIAEVRIFAP